MALEYRLRIATDLTPSQALDVLSRLHGLKADPGRLVGTGVVIYASMESELGQSILREAFNFSPTISLAFRVDKFENWEAGVSTTIRAALELLSQTQGDAVLLFNGEEVVFLRTKGEFILNNGWNFWNPSRLALVALPYEMRNISSL